MTRAITMINRTADQRPGVVLAAIVAVAMAGVGIDVIGAVALV